MSLFVRPARSLLQHKFVVHPVPRIGSVSTVAPARAFATGQRSDASLDKLASRVLNGERAALSKAITLIESANLKHRRDAARVHPHSLLARSIPYYSLDSLPILFTAPA